MFIIHKPYAGLLCPGDTGHSNTPFFTSLIFLIPSFGSMASHWLARSQPKFVVWRFRIGMREGPGTRVKGS